MGKYDELVKKLMSRPGVAAEVARIEREEGELLDALLKARQEAGLTQAELAWAPRPQRLHASNALSGTTWQQLRTICACCG